MENGVLMLHILSPEKTLFKGKVSQVRLPGTRAPFTVLYKAGAVRWNSAEGNGELAVSGGFAEVKDNNVTLCVETL